MREAPGDDEWTGRLADERREEQAAIDANTERFRDLLRKMPPRPIEVLTPGLHVTPGPEWWKAFFVLLYAAWA